MFRACSFLSGTLQTDNQSFWIQCAFDFNWVLVLAAFSSFWHSNFSCVHQLGKCHIFSDICHDFFVFAIWTGRKDVLGEVVSIQKTFLLVLFEEPLFEKEIYSRKSRNFFSQRSPISRLFSSFVYRRRWNWEIPWAERCWHPDREVHSWVSWCF